MLPFLKPKPVAGLIISTRKPDGGKEEEQAPEDGVSACMDDFIRAVHAKDSQAAASAFKDAYDILDSQQMPDESSENSYDSQNAMAAEGNE